MTVLIHAVRFHPLLYPRLSKHGLIRHVFCFTVVDLVPTWPRSMLNGLGRYMEMSGQVFGTNESFRLGQSQFKIAGAIMAEDPVLTGEHETPFGKFFFMQVCGLHHQADYDMIWEWSCQGVLDIISQLSPMRITNTEKPSFLTIPKIKAEIGPYTLSCLSPQSVGDFFSTIFSF